MARGDDDDTDREDAPDPSDATRTLVDKPVGNDGRAKPRPLARGELVGRYVVLGLVGEGAMGAVYSAFDPELDRKIALKVVRHDSDSQSAQTQGRLVKEAQAMARVGHPNVIAVYDVGTFGESVYIAMEFVEGPSLAAWVAASKREPAEILQVFLQAARGLDHAHAAGIVHRDFKPDNCLVGTDGRARVIDFGIARRRGTEEGSTPIDVGELERSPAGSPAELAAAVETRAGMLIGTPAYMSPEQFQGIPADARSDQFAFCVALYEALYGVRPFRGESVLEMMSEVVSCDPRPPPPTPGVPDFVPRALLRGLSRDPAARFESLGELVAALDPPVRSHGITGRRLLLGGGALFVLAAVGAALAPSSGDANVCLGLDSHLSGVWDAPRRAAFAQAFTNSHAPWADAARVRAVASLDTRAEEWTQMRQQTCVATRLRGEQSEDVMDMRMACLDRRLQELRTAVDVVIAGDAERAHHATQLVTDLPPIARCADVGRLRALDERRPAPEISARVDAARTGLAEARALREAGDYDAASAAVDRILETAEALDYAPLTAAALLARARVRVALGRFADGRADLFDAARLADLGGDAEVEASAWIDSIFVSGSKLRQREEGLRWLSFAESALSQLGDAPLLEGRLRYYEGLIYAGTGQSERALEAFALAQERLSSVLPEGHWRLSVVRGARGSALRRSGRHAEAVVEFGAAVAGMRAALGDRHPSLAPLLNNLASALRAAGQLEEAREVYADALALKRETLGSSHPSIAITLVNMARLEHRIGRFEEAEALLAEALELRQRTLGESHPLFASVLASQAEVALDRDDAERGDAERGVDLYRRALTLDEARGDAWEIAIARNNLGWALLRDGRCREAEPIARASLAELLRRDVDSERAAYPRTVLGLCFLDLGRAEEAVGPLTAASEARMEEGTAPEDEGISRYALGRALYESGRDRRAGWHLVRASLAPLEEAGAPGRWVLERARAWLAEREEPEAELPRQ